MTKGSKTFQNTTAEMGIGVPQQPFGAVMALLSERLKLHWSRWSRQRTLPAAEASRARSLADLCWSVATTFTSRDLIRGAVFQTRALRLASATGDPLRIGRALGLGAVHLACQGIRNELRVARIFPRDCGTRRLGQ